MMGTTGKTVTLPHESYDLVEELAETCDMTVKGTLDEIIDYFFRGQFEDLEEDEDEAEDLDDEDEILEEWD